MTTKDQTFRPLENHEESGTRQFKTTSKDGAPGWFDGQTVRDVPSRSERLSTIDELHLQSLSQCEPIGLSARNLSTEDGTPMRLRIMIAILVSASVGAVACPNNDKCPALAQALPLCTVLANANQYDGKEITVRGLHRMVIHGSVLVGADCPRIDVNLRGGPQYKADKRALAVARSLTKKDQFYPVDEILRGIFRVAQKEQCFGQICAHYEIEVSELLCAQAPPKESVPTH